MSLTHCWSGCGFLSISASNLDEFYSVRVAGIRGQVIAGVETPSQDGLTPKEQLSEINRDVAELSETQQNSWNEITSLLDKERIHVVPPENLKEDDSKWLEAYFLEQIFRS